MAFQITDDFLDMLKRVVSEDPTAVKLLVRDSFYEENMTKAILMKKPHRYKESFMDERGQLAAVIFRNGILAVKSGAFVLPESFVLKFMPRSRKVQEIQKFAQFPQNEAEKMFTHVMASKIQATHTGNHYRTTTVCVSDPYGHRK